MLNECCLKKRVMLLVYFRRCVNLVAPCLLRCMDVFGAVNFGWAPRHIHTSGSAPGRVGAVLSLGSSEHFGCLRKWPSFAFLTAGGQRSRSAAHLGVLQMCVCVCASVGAERWCVQHTHAMCVRKAHTHTRNEFVSGQPGAAKWRFLTSLFTER